MKDRKFCKEQAIRFVVEDGMVIDYELYNVLFDFNEISLIIEDELEIYQKNNFNEVKEKIDNILLVFKNDFNIHLPMSLESFINKYNISVEHTGNASKNNDDNILL